MTQNIPQHLIHNRSDNYNYFSVITQVEERGQVSRSTYCIIYSVKIKFQD